MLRVARPIMNCMQVKPLKARVQPHETKSFTLSAADRRRFERYVDRGSSPDACWLWTGGTCSGGYGTFWVGGRVVRAHRLALALHLGRELGPHEIARHTCDHRWPLTDLRGRRCVRPGDGHLVLGSARENREDRIRRLRSRDGRRAPAGRSLW